MVDVTWLGTFVIRIIIVIIVITIIIVIIVITIIIIIVIIIIVITIITIYLSSRAAPTLLSRVGNGSVEVRQLCDDFWWFPEIRVPPNHPF